MIVLKAFRKRGRVYNHVAIEANLDWRTVAQLWKSGVPAYKTYGYPALPPIKDVIEEKVPEPNFKIAPKAEQIQDDQIKDDQIQDEQIQAQPDPPPPPPPQPDPDPLLSKSHQPDPLVPPVEVVAATPLIRQEDFQAHAVSALKSELKSIAVARSGVTGTGVLGQQLLALIQMRIARAKEEIISEIESGVKVDLDTLIKQLSKVSSLLCDSATSQKILIEAERLALGSPTSIIKFLENPVVPQDDPRQLLANSEAANAEMASLYEVLGKLAKDRKALQIAEESNVQEGIFYEEEGGLNEDDDGINV